MSHPIRIRKRERINASPKEGLRQEWTEYQAVQGLRVLARFDLLRQALNAYPDAILDSSIPSSER